MKEESPKKRPKLASYKRPLNLSVTEECIDSIHEVARLMGMSTLSAAVEATMREKLAEMKRDEK
jgi:hypothetical protein